MDVLTVPNTGVGNMESYSEIHERPVLSIVVAKHVLTTTRDTPADSRLPEMGEVFILTSSPRLGRTIFLPCKKCRDNYSVPKSS